MANATQMERKAKVEFPPHPAQSAGRPSVFLAGTTHRTKDDRDWREVATDALSHLPVTIFNPFRPDWDDSWRQDITFAPFKEQVEWELDHQERADVILLYFAPYTDAPISLLELGLAARSGKAIVGCHPEYKRRGNVEVVCRVYGIEFMDTVEDLGAAAVRKLEKMLRDGNKCS